MAGKAIINVALVSGDHAQGQNGSQNLFFCCVAEATAHAGKHCIGLQNLGEDKFVC